MPSMLSLSPLTRQALNSLLPWGLLCSAAVSLAIATYSMMLTPAERRLAAAEQAYSAARASHAHQIAAQRHQERLRLRQRELDQIWGLLPTQRQFPALAVAIAQLAKANRVLIPGMAHTVEPGKDGALPKGLLTFTATGEFMHVYQFIQRLETTDSYVVIESLDVARVGPSAAAVVDLHMTVSTFLQPQPAKKGES